MQVATYWSSGLNTGMNEMTGTFLTRCTVFVAMIGLGLALPAEAWADIIQKVDVAKGYYLEAASVAGILAGLWVLDTVTWPYLTGQD